MTDPDDGVDTTYPPLPLDPWLGVFLTARLAYSVSAAVTDALSDAVDAVGMRGNWRATRRAFAADVGLTIEQLAEEG